MSDSVSVRASACNLEDLVWAAGQAVGPLGAVAAAKLLAHPDGEAVLRAVAEHAEFTGSETSCGIDVVVAVLAQKHPEAFLAHVRAWAAAGNKRQANLWDAGLAAIWNRDREPFLASLLQGTKTEVLAACRLLGQSIGYSEQTFSRELFDLALAAAARVGLDQWDLECLETTGSHVAEGGA